MLRPLLALLAALALGAPLAAQEVAEPPFDAWCPTGDRDLPRGPDWHCYGHLGDDYRFAFVYPKAVERVPELDALVRTEAALAAVEIGVQAEASRAEGGETPRMSYEAHWQLDAILPELAAASASISHYTGGAHGGIEYRTILVDRLSGRRIELADLFQPGFFEPDLFGYRLWGIRAVQSAFCLALTAEVRGRRADPSAEVSCPAIEQQPVALLCGPSGRIDRMRALLNPYVVGSWAEGPYEIDFPVDAAMMASFKRRFRAAFGLPQETRPRTPVRPCL